jgi:hypothetical protein
VEEETNFYERIFYKKRKEISPSARKTRHKHSVCVWLGYHQYLNKRLEIRSSSRDDWSLLSRYMLCYHNLFTKTSIQLHQNARIHLYTIHYQTFPVIEGTCRYSSRTLINDSKDSADINLLDRCSR